MHVSDTQGPFPQGSRHGFPSLFLKNWMFAADCRLAMGPFPPGRRGGVGRIRRVPGFGAKVSYHGAEPRRRVASSHRVPPGNRFRTHRLRQHRNGAVRAEEPGRGITPVEPCPPPRDGTALPNRDWAAIWTFGRWKSRSGSSTCGKGRRTTGPQGNRARCPWFWRWSSGSGP